MLRNLLLTLLQVRESLYRRNRIHFDGQSGANNRLPSWTLHGYRHPGKQKFVLLTLTRVVPLQNCLTVGLKPHSVCPVKEQRMGKTPDPEETLWPGDTVIYVSGATGTSFYPEFLLHHHLLPVSLLISCRGLAFPQNPESGPSWKQTQSWVVQ